MYICILDTNEKKVKELPRRLDISHGEGFAVN